MDKLNNIKVLLDNIHLLQETEITYDERNIFKEYQLLAENNSSLVIKLLSIFGGFIATLTFLGFLAAAGLYESGIGLLVFGVGFIISAIFLNKKYDKLIIDTFSLSMYVIGIAMLAFGLLQLEISANIITVLIIIIAFINLKITQTYILSFVSVLTVGVGFIVLIISNEAYELLHVYVAVYTLGLTYSYLNEAKLISLNKKLSYLYDPIRIGLIISLLFGLVLIGKRALIPISQNYIWISSIVMIAVIFYLIHTILLILEIESVKRKTLIYSLSSLMLVSTLFSPSISGAIVILLLCFLVNYKTGFVLGIISIIYFISQYYYDLHLTLLTKSMLLFVSGMMFLLFYFLITNKKRFV